MVEKEVEDCFKRFIVNVEEKENESESTRKMIEKGISLSEAKLKRLYTLYASGNSGTDTLLDVIQAEGFHGLTGGAAGSFSVTVIARTGRFLEQEVQFLFHLIVLGQVGGHDITMSHFFAEFFKSLVIFR